jgi:hypothetical protein
MKALLFLFTLAALTTFASARPDEGGIGHSLTGRTMLAVAQTSEAAQAPDTQAPQASRPPLVPCEEGAEMMPCVVLAMQPEDIAGIWRQYLGNPMLNAPDGMGFIRYNMDGTFALADTPENTAAPYPPYPHGTYTLENGVITISVEGEMVPPECRTARHELRVYRYGDQPVALHYVHIEDDCVGRRQDMSHPVVWVAPAAE